MTEQATPTFKSQSGILEIPSQGWFARAQPRQAGGRRSQRQQQKVLTMDCALEINGEENPAPVVSGLGHGCGIMVTDA